MKDTINAAKGKMQKTIDSLSREFVTIRAGRANPDLLNRVSAEYYGTMTPVSQLAQIKVSEGRTLVITPYDASAFKSIEKAILASDIGITPINDGKAIRLTVPQPTEEKRKELCKTVKKYGEEAKVSVRSVRRDTMDKFKTMKKNSEITEDDLKQCENDLQKVVDKFCAEIDSLVAEKEKEVTTI